MSNVRYVALDAFRGLTIALMILVNTPGSWSAVYSPLLHADWHGVTATDLIFPFFLFIIGSALYFSLTNSNAKSDAGSILKIIKRSALIFCLGLLLNCYGHAGDLSELRIMGVLQRLGIAYGVAAILLIALKPKPLLFFSLAILLFYWWLLTTVGDDAYTLTSNLVRKVDLTIFGASHLYQGKGLAFDPEGLLSTLPAVVNVIIGFEATKWLNRARDKKQGMRNLVLAAVLMISISWLWQLVLPLNKSLWTSSFVLFSSACSLFILAFFIWLVDVKGQRKLVDPLLVYGTNPMFIYVLSWLWVSTYYLIEIKHKNELININDYLFLLLERWFPANLASLIFALLHVLLFWFISNILYKKQIIIKI